MVTGGGNRAETGSAAIDRTGAAPAIRTGGHGAGVAARSTMPSMVATVIEPKVACAIWSISALWANATEDHGLADHIKWVFGAASLRGMRLPRPSGLRAR